MKKLLLTFMFCCTAIFANAQVEKLLGYWTQIDDKTGKEEGVFYIFKATDGLYYGKFIRSLDPQSEDAVCEKCTGEDKGKPLKGMIMMKRLKADDNELVGGTIIDPRSGKTYHCKMFYDAKKDRLCLKGSLDKIGIFRRTQYWKRRDSEQ